MRFPCTLILVFFFFTLQAQQKFIEVNVSDTVLVEADLFVYKINFIPDESGVYDESANKNPAEFARKLERRTKILRYTYDSLISKLKAQHFSFISPSPVDSFNISQHRYGSFSTAVVLHSPDSLLALYQSIKNVKNLTGSVEIAKATNELSYENALFKKLINEATDKAKAIGSITNQKIINIQSVIETKKDAYPGGWTAYPPLSVLTESVIPGWHTSFKGSADVITTDTPVNYRYAVTASLTVRFSVE